MQELYEQYADQGFEIVGIHAPEFDYEAEVPNIEEAAAELGVTWPIVLDTNKRTFHSVAGGADGTLATDLPPRPRRQHPLRPHRRGPLRRDRRRRAGAARRAELTGRVRRAAGVLRGHPATVQPCTLLLLVPADRDGDRHPRPVGGRSRRSASARCSAAGCSSPTWWHSTDGSCQLSGALAVAAIARVADRTVRPAAALGDDRERRRQRSPARHVRGDAVVATVHRRGTRRDPDRRPKRRRRRAARDHRLHARRDDTGARCRAGGPGGRCRRPWRHGEPDGAAGAVGLVVAAAVAVGRHDELVTTLTRWTTS